MDSVSKDKLKAEGFLPLDDWHRAQGARMVNFVGYHMPIHYQGIIAEHLWTRCHASLFDVSHMGQILLTDILPTKKIHTKNSPPKSKNEAVGTAARVAAALEHFVPSRLSNLAVGRMRYSLLLTDTGGILDDLMISNRGDDLYLVVNGARKIGDIAHLRYYLPNDIHLDHWQDRALLALQGPAAGAVLARLIPDVEVLNFMEAGEFIWRGVPLWISRSGYTGEDGFEISISASAAVALADALVADEAVKPAGLGARDSLRMEAGLPLYGQDLNEEIDPITAGLGFAVSKQRCGVTSAGFGAGRTGVGAGRVATGQTEFPQANNFLGKARIVALLHRGPDQKRVGLRVAGQVPLRAGAILLGDNGQPIGRVTSGGYAPSVGAPIAMGYIAAQYRGDTLYAEVRGKEVTAEITALPFVPHRYWRKNTKNI